MVELTALTNKNWIVLIATAISSRDYHLFIVVKKYAVDILQLNNGFTYRKV